MKFHQDYQLRAVLSVHGLSKTQVLTQVTKSYQHNQQTDKIIHLMVKMYELSSPHSQTLCGIQLPSYMSDTSGGMECTVQ